MDSPLAFSTLLTSRMTELDLTTAEVAHAVEEDVSVVAAWVDGTERPEDESIEPLAKVLSLPRSLLREARRRADEAARRFEDDAEPVAPPLVVDRDATFEQPIPVVVPAVVVDQTKVEEAVPDSSLRSPWRMLLSRLQRSKVVARAPTRQPSYLEDGRQRTTYQLRAIYTVGAVFALVLVLRWAFSGFGDAVSDLWNALTSAL